MVQLMSQLDYGYMYSHTQFHNLFTYTIVSGWQKTIDSYRQNVCQLYS